MNERFSLYLRIKKISQRKLARLSCVQPSAVSRFCNGGAISSDKLLQMLQACDDLSLEWLFYGTGDMLRSCGNQTTINMGAYAGADVVGEGGVQVKNANGVSVRQGSDRRYDEIILQKDKVIAEKDRIILEKDETIKELLERILKT